MNVFIIPSWYPDRNSIISGIFVKEQAEALADSYPEHNFILSNCENFYLSITKPAEFIKVYRQHSKAESIIKDKSKNLTELYKPALTWTGKFKGDIKNIVKAHLENFNYARKKFGAMDIIHSHSAYPGGYSAMIISRESKIPYVVTEHMAPFPFESYLINGKLSDNVSLPLVNADGIIAVSNFQAERIKSFGIKQPVVIPNVVNEEEFKADQARSPNTKIKFLTVTTFIERKGIEELLAAILNCNDKCKDCEFTIAGTGHLENYIENFISDNSLGGKVILIKDPSREEIVRLYKQCDIFILTSRLESFGIVYVEALACGKPVIATDCGGPRDFMHDKTGLLVEVGNVNEISNAILKMASGHKKYDPLNIRNFFMDNFSRQIVCEKIISYYKKILLQNVPT